MDKTAFVEKTHYRYLRVEPANFEDDNTIQVAFSSEFPGRQRADKNDEAMGIAKEGEMYTEILSHAEGDYDLSKMQGRAAFLDEHVAMRQLGNVEKAVVSKDRVGRAVLKFDGASRLSKVRQKQMRAPGDEGRKNISFGYNLTRYIGTRALDGGGVGHVFAWSGYEISSVANPMDPTVGAYRSADESQACCIGCGQKFDRSKLSDDYFCDPCGAAADDGEAERVHPGGHVRVAPLAAPDANAKFRGKKTGQEFEISHSDLRNKVGAKADADKRYKSKRSNGDVYSDFYVHDITMTVKADGDTAWKALIVGPEYKMYETEFDFDGSEVTLGEHQEVELNQQWQPVNRAAVEPPKTRSFDLKQIVTGLTPEEKMNMKTLLLDAAATAGGGAATLDEPKIRADQEGKTRAAVMAEFDARAVKRAARNKEIHDLADAGVKDFGCMWNGPDGGVYVVGEKIRSLEAEVCNAPDDRTAAEVRLESKSRLDAFTRGARKPLEQTDAANLEDKLASRVSISRIFREAGLEKNKGHRAFVVQDGAEYEAHKELLRKLDQYPTAEGSDMGGGLLIPANAPCHTRFARKSYTRDSLAGDFTTAGALIAPQFVMPTIELLRNRLSLSKAGITFLGGVLGNLVLPRQDAPTTPQSLPEGQAALEYDQVFGQVKLFPHRSTTMQKYSRLALLQSTPDFEALVMADHLAVHAIYMDEMILNGSGAQDQPLGIINQLGIGAVTFAGSAANAYKNTVQLETLIRKSNIYDDLTFITTSVGRGSLRITPATLTGATVVSGQTTALWVGEEVVGRPAVDSQQVPNDILVCLAGRHVVVAQWGGLSIVLDTMTFADQDKYRLTINTYFDAALRHSSAVSRSVDSIATLS